MLTSRKGCVNPKTQTISYGLASVDAIASLAGVLEIKLIDLISANNVAKAVFPFTQYCENFIRRPVFLS